MGLELPKEHEWVTTEHPEGLGHKLGKRACSGRLTRELPCDEAISRSSSS